MPADLDVSEVEVRQLNEKYGCTGVFCMYWLTSSNTVWAFDVENLFSPTASKSFQLESPTLSCKGKGYGFQSGVHV
jgi:hypothetical protein